MAKKKTAKTKDVQTTTNISMPSRLRRFVDERVEVGGFGNVSEYFRHLVRKEQDKLDEARRRMRVLIQEGERSGPPIVADDKFWAERFAKLERRLGTRRRKAG